MISVSIIHINLHKSNNKLIVHCWNIFGARTNHGHTQFHKIHKIHHDLDLGEATTFPIIMFSVTRHKGYMQMTFFTRFPSWKYPNSWNWDSCHFGCPKLLVQTFDWSETERKVVAFIKSFPMICGTFFTYTSLFINNVMCIVYIWMLYACSYCLNMDVVCLFMLFTNESRAHIFCV